MSRAQVAEPRTASRIVAAALLRHPDAAGLGAAEVGMGAVKRRAVRWFRHFGYDVRRTESRAEWRWVDHVRPIGARRKAQTSDDARALAEKYRLPVFGPVTMWELLERLAQCIDETDPRLGLVSQLVHALQVAEAMEADGVDDPDLLVTALIHDVGKVLLLVGEDPANVGGGTAVMASGGAGRGLDRCTLQWGADEFAYSRLEGHVPDHVAWLVRYHSLDIASCRNYMDERDLRYVDAYLARFQQYDDPSKSWWHLPNRRLEDYRDLIDEWFPAPLVV